MSDECQRAYRKGYSKGLHGEGFFDEIMNQALGWLVPGTKEWESYVAGVRDGIQERHQGRSDDDRTESEDSDEIESYSGNRSSGSWSSDDTSSTSEDTPATSEAIAFGFAIYGVVLYLSIAKWVEIYHCPHCGSPDNLLWFPLSIFAAPIAVIVGLMSLGGLQNRVKLSLTTSQHGYLGKLIFCAISVLAPSLALVSFSPPNEAAATVPTYTLHCGESDRNLNINTRRILLVVPPGNCFSDWIVIPRGDYWSLNLNPSGRVIYQFPGGIFRNDEPGKSTYSDVKPRRLRIRNLENSSVTVELSY